MAPARSQSSSPSLSQFPNAKVKENAPLRAKAVASKVKAHGPGLEPTGVVAKAPAKFTVETFGAGDGELNITVKGPGDTDYKVDRSFNNDRKKSWACSYFPDKEANLCFVYLSYILLVLSKSFIITGVKQSFTL